MKSTVIKDTFTKKFSMLDNLVSKELIKEENDYIIITDNIIDRYTAKRYLGNDAKVDAVFDKISYFGIRFNKFFKFEVIKLFEKIIKNRVRYGVKLEKIKEALRILKPEIDNKDVMAKFDRNHLEAVMDFKVLPHQELPLKKYMEFKDIFGYRGMLLHGGVGTGKAQPLSAKILTPIGWRPMGAIRPGQLVATQDGGFTKVLAVYPQGVKKIYKITFQDGRSTECCEDHLWEVYYYKTIKNKKENGKKVSTSVLEKKVIDTKEIIKSLDNLYSKSKENRKVNDRLWIPLPEPTEFKEKDYFIDPYIMGVILGDGGISDERGGVKLHSQDTEIYNKINSKLKPGYKLSYSYYVNHTGNSQISATIIKDESISKDKINLYRAWLQEFGLMGHKSYEKFIPKVYLTGSVEQRWELLRGLLDTDGTVYDPHKAKGRTGKCSKSGSITYSTSSERLKDNVAELVRSLGGRCKIGIKYPFYTHKGERKPGRINYVLHISFKNPKLAVSRSFLKNRLEETNQYSNNFRLRIESIEEVREEKAQCIRVEHPSHLYITDNYVVTHNTATSLFIMEGLHNEVDKVIIMCPLPTVDRVWISTIAGDSGSRCFKEPSSIYVVKDNKPYDNEKYIVCHFEGLEKLQSIINKISNSRIGIIIDESHYLAEAKSKRTQEALDVLNKTKSENVLLLSGTPIKSGYREMGTIFKFLDPLFVDKAEDKYYTLYKSPTEWLSCVLKERYNGYTTVVKKDNIETTGLQTVNLKIKLPEEEMEQFYLKNIKIRLNKFVTERMEELKSNMDYWIDTYVNLRDKAKDNNPSINEKEFKLYMANVETIKRTNPTQFGYIKDVLAYCTQFEKIQLIPYLNSEEAKLFAEAKTIYKYPVLKVQGEALANIIGKARIDCHAMMAEYLQYNKILDATDKKTIIFSNYIEVCDRVMDTVKKGNYTPIGIYGETTKNLTQLVQQFTNSPKVNPLVTTYKSLSTGVPLIAADTIICIDMPFRMYVYEQAIGRAWRLGQDSDVTVFILELDTNEPNINSRNIDIITFFKEEVEKITGVPASINISSESYIDNYISNESLDGNYDINDISIDIATEAAKSPKRRQVEDYILKYIAKIVSGDHNIKLYKDLFNRMTDKEFHEYMVKLKNKEITLSIIVPNGSKDIKVDINNNIKIAKELGFSFFQNIHFGKDGDNPGYITPNEYMVIKLPVKRAAQLLDKKISIARDPNAVSSLTGQVSGDSRSSKLSGPEIQVLIGVGCKKSLIELLKIRGGDLGAGNAMEQMIIQTGNARQEDIIKYSTGVKSTDTLRNYFIAAHINSTL